MRALVLLLALVLGGCAALELPEHSNRIACTLAADDAFVVSQYGPVGLTGRIHPEDRAIACKRQASPERAPHGKATQAPSSAQEERPVPPPQVK